MRIGVVQLEAWFVGLVVDEFVVPVGQFHRQEQAARSALAEYLAKGHADARVYRARLDPESAEQLPMA